jgi:hypothetical protein
MTDKKLTRSFRLTGLFALLALTGLSSCEKVIDINLNKSEKKYVVEAIVTDQSGARVLLSQTKDFEDNNNFAGVSGAVVEITENGGATTTLSETTTTGVYEAPALIGSTGKTYSLSVKVNGQSFTAVSTMPQKVNLDTIYITDEFLFGDTRKIVNIEYKDPPGRGQYYRFVQYLNGRKETEIFVQNDEYTDGRNVTNKLFYFPDDDEDNRKIKSGDQVRIEMFCTDANVYKYWYSLYRSATGESQATPANPVSNMKGGALGYFSAQTSQVKTMIAP